MLGPWTFTTTQEWKTNETTFTSSLALIEMAMQEGDETMAKELQKKLHDAGMEISLQIILKGWMDILWRAYCQMMHEVNKQKCLEWAIANVDDDFEDVIWTDETSVQLKAIAIFAAKYGQ